MNATSRILGIVAILVSFSLSAQAGVMSTATANHTLKFLGHVVGVDLSDSFNISTRVDTINGYESFVFDPEGNTQASHSAFIDGNAFSGEVSFPANSIVDLSVTAIAERDSVGLTLAEAKAFVSIEIENKSSDHGLLLQFEYFSSVLSSVGNANIFVDPLTGLTTHNSFGSNFVVTTFLESPSGGLGTTPPSELSVVPAATDSLATGNFGSIAGDGPRVIDVFVSSGQMVNLSLGTFATASAQVAVAAVPEPSTVAVWSVLAMGTVLPRRRRR